MNEQRSIHCGSKIFFNTSFLGFFPSSYSHRKSCNFVTTAIPEDDHRLQLELDSLWVCPTHVTFVPSYTTSRNVTLVCNIFLNMSYSHANSLGPTLSSSDPSGAGGGGTPRKNWVGVCGPLPKTLTLFMTKICDIPYYFYDLTKSSKPNL